MRAPCIGLASALVGCAPDEEPPVDLPIEVCGQDEPVQILALEDEQVIGDYGGVARYGDRWLFGVRTFEIPLTRVDHALGSPDDRLYRQIDAAILATGDCGERPQLVAQGLDIIAPRFREDEPWLACARDSYGVYWFDPDGVRAPELVDEDLSCGNHVAIGGTIVFYRSGGELAKARMEDGEVVVDVLLDSIESGELVGQWSTDEPDDLVVTRVDRTVVDVDLRTGEILTLAEDVPAAVMVSPDRRWLLWFEEASPAVGPRPWLRDLGTGSERSVGDEEWTAISVQLVDSFLLLSGVLPFSGWTTQLLSLPSQREEWLEGRTYAVDGDAQAPVLMVHDGTLVLFDLDTGTQTPLEGEYSEYEDRTLWSRRHDAYLGLGLSAAYLPWDIVGFPVETREYEIVRARVFSSVDLGGDQWVVASERDENGLIQLEHLDGEMLEHHPFASDVVPGSFDTRNDASVAGPWRTDELVYQVHTRASDRTGVWRVRFTP